MLTQSDLQALGKLIDKKIGEMGTDIAAIQARIADMETAQFTLSDSLEIRSLLHSVEKRVAAIEGKLTKFVTRDDLQTLESRMVTKEYLDAQFKKNFRGVARKRDINALERRLIKKLNFVIDSFDREIIEAKEKLKTLEQRTGIPSLS